MIHSLGTCLGVLCIIGVLAECASIFPTAGGAYHFSTFLAPERYRRYVGYPLGWLNYLGWVFTIAACASIATGLTYSLAVLTHPEFAIGPRWHLFLVYVGWVMVAWLINLYCLGLLDHIENVGCKKKFACVDIDQALRLTSDLVIINVLGFVGFSIALLAKAPKASAEFVFVEVINETGSVHILTTLPQAFYLSMEHRYSSPAMAVVLGLFNSIIAYVCLDAACHLAEEVATPTKEVPRILWATWISQSLVGMVWILVIGFSIQDIEPIISTPTGSVTHVRGKIVFFG